MSETQNTTPTEQPYDMVGELIAFESEDFDTERTVRLFQELVNTGYAWKLQGSYGRMAESLIEQGYITVGTERRPTMFGAPMAAQSDLEPGSMGTQEYVDAKNAERKAKE